ncbi:MAG TPA: choline kinase family protein [Erysipelothrix sp.]
MKPIDKINQLFKNKTIQNKHYLQQGITNDNYYFEVDNQARVIRIPKKGNQQLFDYHHEEQVLHLIAALDIDVPLLYYNANNGIKVTEFIPNAEHFDIRYRQRATLLIKKLHQAKIKTGKIYSIKNSFKKYQALIKNPIYDTSFAWSVLDEIENLNYEPILCHNDLVEGNFLFTKNHDYLIDYEYAMDNHPYFDLMSFITENDIQDQKAREEIYLTYFGHLPSAQEQATLLLFERGLHVLWCEWGMAMYELHQEQIYHDIAALKYQRLKETYQ